MTIGIVGVLLTLFNFNMSSSPSILYDSTESRGGGFTPYRFSIIHKKSRSARDLNEIISPLFKVILDTLRYTLPYTLPE